MGIPVVAHAPITELFNSVLESVQTHVPPTGITPSIEGASAHPNQNQIDAFQNLLKKDSAPPIDNIANTAQTEPLSPRYILDTQFQVLNKVVGVQALASAAGKLSTDIDKLTSLQ